MTMRTNDLIELAALDALGLLDETESAAYERAFQAASPMVRRQVRAEQERAAEFEAALLPYVTPDEDLKAKVLARLAEEKALELASGTRALVHRPGRVVPKVRASRRVTPLWRAASIGLSVAVVVLGVMAIYLQDSNSKLVDAFVVNDFYDKVGTRQLHDTLFDETTERQILQVAADAPASFSADAVLLVNPDWGDTARFFCTGLFERDTPNNYALCVVDENQEVVATIEQFKSDGKLVSFDISTASLSQGRLALFTRTADGLGKLLMIA